MFFCLHYMERRGSGMFILHKSRSYLIHIGTLIEIGALWLRQVRLASLVAFLRGFMPQKTAFITTTISATTAMDTQKPMSSPNKSTVPNSVIQISFQFIVSTSFYSSSP